ncbi:hypothetical protein HK104_002825 [Borealophlyctis nickersoniae]|nr:hypothetical protein HK104_002825 [Borealophlyctis nickersoniae]
MPRTTPVVEDVDTAPKYRSSSLASKSRLLLTLLQLLFLVAVIVAIIVLVVQAIKIKNDVEEKVKFVSAQIAVVGKEVENVAGDIKSIANKVGASVQTAVNNVAQGGQGAVATVTSAFGAIPSVE